jgi:signal transduction histidine kinase
MSRIVPNHVSAAGTRHLWWSFVVIVAAFAVGNIVSIYEMRYSQAQVRLITRVAATNIEIVTWLSRDFQQKQHLVEDHLFEKKKGHMDRIEAQLAGIDADIAGRLREYEAIENEVNERITLRRLKTEMTGLEPRIADVLSLSRRNQDAAARTQLTAMEPQFLSINHAVDTLLVLNQTRANQRAARVHTIQLSAVVFMAALTALGTVFALLTARWITRMVGAHQSALEERNRELDAFAGRVAHDLRGPMTSINLAASTLALHGGEESAILRRGVNRMESMIEDLLTLSRISTQTAGATCRAENVAELAREDLTPIVEAAGGTLVVEAASASVSCSEGLLRQVLWNLGENAVKYRSPEVQLQVRIDGRIVPNAYEIRVSDNGTGMSPSDARQACEPFFRGKETDSTPGVGLGLSIVKRVIEASGGKITVDSTPGQGTTFSLLLQRAAGQMAA